MCSALRTFGKYQGVTESLMTRGNDRLRGSGKTIGVQPTATARRAHMGRGARRMTSGRPAKSPFVKEHGYSIDKKKRRTAAPHSLSHAVEYNQSLGKSHGAK
ncbi:uncharacterized protein LOC117101627 [Anneissia japonica]|uniref:uncharacterized protein LOC117101627 n=1 Tax=Anneissia japonica TaxID=1529436 RepID=UPI0014258F30|nr:uncharacterized protein LOC117101627 [Anneissia japonica]